MGFLEGGDDLGQDVGAWGAGGHNCNPGRHRLAQSAKTEGGMPEERFRAQHMCGEVFARRRQGP